jgi:hypothetical protein
LFDVEAIEIAELQLDRLVERRAVEARDGEPVEAAWAESVRRHHARQQEANREAWCDFHRHMERLHASLSAEHRERAAALLSPGAS